MQYCSENLIDFIVLGLVTIHHLARLQEALVLVHQAGHRVIPVVQVARQVDQVILSIPDRDLDILAPFLVAQEAHRFWTDVGSPGKASLTQAY